MKLSEVAYLRSGEIIHTGPALALACLLKAVGTRNKEDEEFVQRLLNDPNIDPKK